MKKLITSLISSIPESVLKSSVFILIINILSMTYSVLWILTCYELFLRVFRISGIYLIPLLIILYVGWKVNVVIGKFLIAPFYKED